MQASGVTMDSKPEHSGTYRIGPITVNPATPAIGAEIRDVDISRALDTETIVAIKQAWHAHLVLLFRGQTLTPEQQIHFSSYFGLPQSPNRTSFTPMTEQYPEIVEVMNVGMDQERLDRSLGSAEAFWHTDMSYKEIPPAASALYSREVPPEGGNTCVCNMYMAYDDLPPDLLSQIEGRKAVHDASRNSAGRLRPGFEDEQDPRKTPGPHHPLVRTHPETGRKALFLGRRPYSYIPGLPLEESEALLDRLWAHAAQEQYAWCHSWAVGDLLLWDNRCAMHRRDPFDMKQRRVMHRTQIAGVRPY
ncbi:MAG: TauD/TfdA family dioxygenase [Alphaproteobacteria bacterium]|nr:TauD/TfdA family dioxygenase [Alphaproteobacteria bacterium]